MNFSCRQSVSQLALVGLNWIGNIAQHALKSSHEHDASSHAAPRLRAAT